MGTYIKKIPIPICGVALGLAALGNLLQSYSEGVRYFCGALSLAALILMLLKLLAYPAMVKEDMHNPIMASVSATCPMALMLLSAYAKPFLGSVSLLIWWVAIGWHVGLILYFTGQFLLKNFQLPKVFASYFIVYVGIAAGAVSAPAYGMEKVGTVLFWFAFVSLIFLLILVTIRYVQYREVPAPAKPLFCIYAAPTSLCIAGYIQSVTPKAYGFLIAMYVLAAVLYVIALVYGIGCLKGGFFPSFAAFTFPFVISAIASKQLNACLTNMGKPLGILKVIVPVQTVIAVILVAYVLICFLRFIFSSGKAPAGK